MIRHDRPKTIADVARVATDAEKFSFALRNFLDGFYSAPSKECLAEEPRRLTDILSDDGLADAYFAAIAEHLAKQFGLPKPEWTCGTGRTMKMPWFSMDSHAGRMFLITESPSAFRQRNIFVSADALSRV